MKKFLMLVVVLIAVGTGYVYVNSGAIVKSFIEAQGSAATGVRVSVESVELNVLNGEATLRGLRVGNPEGFSAAAALSVDVISVGLDANTISKDVMRLTKIYVENPVLIYETVDGVSNFHVIRQSAQSANPPSSNDEAEVQKFIVDLIEFTSGTLNAVGVSPSGEELNTALPGFSIKDMGKAEGGLPAATIASRIAVAITTRVIEAVLVGALFDGLGDPLGDMPDIITDTLFGASKAQD